MTEAMVIPDWRQKARAGIPLAAAKKEYGASGLPDGIAKDLSRILRPQAAYRWLLPQLAAITPQYIEYTLRGALAGSHVQAWELFDLMEDSWPRLVKNLNTVKRAVQNLEFKVEPFHEQDQPPTPEAIEKSHLVNNALFGFRPRADMDENDFLGTVFDILDAWGKGVSVLEVDWMIRNAGKLGDITAPRATFWVHPVCYAWSMEGQLGLRLELTNKGPLLYPGVWQSTTYQPRPDQVNEFPPDKFLISVRRARSSTALAGALLRPLAWWWCAANFSADWLLNLGQVFGLPFRWVNYSAAAPQATVDAICSMLQNLGSAGWAAFPEGAELKFIESMKSASQTPQAEMLDRADKNCDLLILGQTLTSDTSKQGGSLALGKVHQDVQDEVVMAAGRHVCGVFNTQLIPSILRLNYGEDGADEQTPVLVASPKKEEDELAKAQCDQIIFPLMPIPKKWAYNRYNIPIPAPDEETIGGPQQPVDGQDPNNPNQPPGKNSHPQAPKPKVGPAELSGKSDHEGRSTPGPSTKFEDNSSDVLAKALLADLDPINKRLAAIQRIQDPQIMLQKLKDFMDDIEQLAADVAHDPETARALADIISASFANGVLADGASLKTKTP